ncbi:hypothetical protein [Pleomorphovibrio marinus]|uniref:hypothetical protein n=1 Tax=Pleomorphovibrio marinus TaxID=2164132 RepID=UPI000E0C24E3|nr:hypothetical protein [Pleomorphovibrio marinus]
MKANAEKRNKNDVVWIGVIQDNSEKRNHLKALEKMIFDISQVIRKPIANVLNIRNVIHSLEFSNEEKMEMLSVIFEEMDRLDQAISHLNGEYDPLRKSQKIVWKEN